MRSLRAKDCFLVAIVSPFQSYVGSVGKGKLSGLNSGINPWNTEWGIPEYASASA